MNDEKRTKSDRTPTASEERKNELRVTIAGHPGRGKDSVAIVVADALKAFGAEVTVDLDGDVTSYYFNCDEERLMNRARSVLARLGTSMRVTIETAQLPRVPDASEEPPCMTIGEETVWAVEFVRSFAIYADPGVAAGDAARVVIAARSIKPPWVSQ